MERLQAAIEKAREQRDGLKDERRPGTKAPKPPKPDVEDAWMALPEIKLRKGRMLRNRIVTFQSGPASAPYDIMRTRLIQQAQSNNWRRIAVVSPHSSCGKSTSVANLAFGLGRQGGIRSLVMDFDLRRHGLTRLLGQKGHVAMADVLENRTPFEEAAQRYGKNLIFGLGFVASQRSAEILQSSGAQNVLEKIDATYAPDFMIFDLPPLSASDDNYGFLSSVDAALIIVEAERTSMTQIDVAERQVAELTNVMGIVLNKCRYVSGAYGYEDGYY